MSPRFSTATSSLIITLHFPIPDSLSNSLPLTWGVWSHYFHKVLSCNNGRRGLYCGCSYETKFKSDQQLYNLQSGLLTLSSHWTAINMLIKSLPGQSIYANLTVKMHVQYVNDYECMHVYLCVDQTCSIFWGESQVFVSPHCIFHFSAHQCKCQYSLTSCPKMHTATYLDTNDMQLTCEHTHGCMYIYCLAY